MREAGVRHALGRGVTFFATAPSYGNGASEALLGGVLRGWRDAVHDRDEGRPAGGSPGVA